jgi:hypothetical protein
MHMYTGNNIVPNQKQLTSMASLIREMSGESLSVIVYTRCSDEAIFVK